MRYALALLVPLGLIVLHLLAAPYTKVEESFHVQAVHDILAHGLPWGFNDPNLNRTNYDHFAFPGAVPRSAVGAAFLALLSKPVILLNDAINQQLLARGILGLLNATAIAYYATGLRHTFGKTVAIWYILLQTSQFHLIYYASRPLSNMFAFPLTTAALRLLLPSPKSTTTNKNIGKALALLTFSGVIFRSELALLVATQTLFALTTHKITLKTTITSGLIGALSALSLTLLLDGSFWQRFPLWPELEAFLFNVLDGKSSDWGTEPWSWYFTNALPRLLLNPLVYILAIPVALRQPATRLSAFRLLVPELVFVALYSFMPHKEWRFIVYIIPSLTAAAALGAGYLWTHRRRSFFMCWASRLLALSVVLTACLSSSVLLPASAVNYPGGRALDALHSYHARSGLGMEGVNVYLGNLACQTGVTRFVQLPDGSGWIYDKTEDEIVKSTGEFWDRFDYVLVEASGESGYMDSDEMRLREALPSSLWEIVYVADSFAGISILRPGIPATGTTEKRILSIVGGSGAVNVFESVRERVRGTLLRGWWVEVKMKPRVQVLRRVRAIKS
ncbi:hypothetical protein PENANT_c001G06931 [Penicillium antarcticum]|uniref:Mannosyltransferase n=1 Tax=Penicillium antarcticum TaxID=416450 RepID=A0A1V6QN43_9EURO|nr:uncharacterized protein N7508_010804 [Penicillium antarcticum]KAJ5295983.1 hypothetical protein N7508_010804 [Penicillium antarcticum]OQD90397.1 hypothetical protein PENANT_c001G06931 [Penicillium antarcticum]